MIFERLVIQNVGVYKGLHSVDLSPHSKRKPIVLFGALNGAGKTTIIDALQLVLYGKNAVGTNRKGSAYHEHLRSLISRDVSARREGAALELTIRLSNAGAEDTYELKRLWRETESGSIKETFEVWRNGIIDEFAASNWDEVVEGILPRGISQLFFFDGEKIEELADPSKAAETIRTGVHALLGLDIVDQLRRDLLQVEKKRAKGAAPDHRAQELIELEERQATLESDSENAGQMAAGALSALEQSRRKFEAVQQRYRALGGKQPEEVRALEVEAGRASEAVAAGRERLKALVAGKAPLVLIRGMVDELRSQAAQEMDSRAALEMLSTLEERDAGLLAVLVNENASPALRSTVEHYLAKDRERWRTQIGAEKVLGELGRALTVPPSEELAELRIELVEGISKVADGRDQAALLHKRLSALPPESDLASLSSEIVELNAEIERRQIRCEFLEEEYRKVRVELARTTEKCKQARHALLESEYGRSKDERVLRQISVVQEILDDFRQQVASKHLRVLEDLILESFQALVRKPGLVNSVRLDAETFQLVLFDRSGATIDPVTFSAGERQLLAVAILWGLAKASGRPLPAVIDTPLGRLDSNHRRNLVENYFPTASHQVILLSTDEEIDGKYHERLTNSISREYQIVYDELRDGSRIESGYFH